VSTAPVLRPLGVGEVLDVALAVYRRNAFALWRIVAVVVALPAALNGAVAVAQRQFADGDARKSASFLVLLAIVVLVTVFASLLATSAAYRLVADAYLGRPVDPDASLRFGLRRLRSVVWVFVLVFAAYFVPAVAIALAPGLLLVFIVPGVYLFVVWTLAIPVVLGEDARGVKALKRARALVRGRFWACFGTLILSLILEGIIALGIAAVFEGIASSSDNQVVIFFDQGIASLISNTLVLPFQVAVTTVLYIDLRVRKEGFDIQLLTHALGPGGTGGR
jgi:hypothetical protein